MGSYPKRHSSSYVMTHIVLIVIEIRHRQKVCCFNENGFFGYEVIILLEKQMKQLQPLQMHQRLASLLSDDAVVSSQMYIAVDFDNALEFENNGKGYETKELAKGTGAQRLCGGTMSRLQDRCLQMIMCTWWVGWMHSCKCSTREEPWCCGWPPRHSYWGCR